jgi:hypothetical protein
MRTFITSCTNNNNQILHYQFFSFLLLRGTKSKVIVFLMILKKINKTKIKLLNKLINLQVSFSFIL